MSVINEKLEIGVYRKTGEIGNSKLEIGIWLQYILLNTNFKFQTSNFSNNRK